MEYINFNQVNKIVRQPKKKYPYLELVTVYKRNWWGKIISQSQKYYHPYDHKNYNLNEVLDKYDFLYFEDGEFYFNPHLEIIYSDSKEKFFVEDEEDLDKLLKIITDKYNFLAIVI